MTAEERDAWFLAQVLPLESSLERFLQRNWRIADEVADLRQEVYARVYERASPIEMRSVEAFVISTARNLLIDKARRAKVVSIETYADLETVSAVPDEISLERTLNARSELRLLEAALKGLPLRCRQVIELRKIEGLSQREVAVHMGITEDTVERHVSKGVRVLAAALAQGSRPPVQPTDIGQIGQQPKI